MSQKIQVKCLVTLLLLTLSSTAQAKTPVVEWIQQMGGFGHGVSADGSGNAYVTGWIEYSLDGNPNVGGHDMFLAKYDTDGTRLWAEQLNSGSYERGMYNEGFGVSVDGSGNAYVTGYGLGNLDGNPTAGKIDVFLTKYDTTGTKQWTEQLGSTSDDCGFGVSVDGSGNAYVTGYTFGSLDGNTNAGNGDMFLTKYDTNGTKLWTELLGSTGEDIGYGVSVDSNGNAYVTGSTYRNLVENNLVGTKDMFLTKYDTNGIKLWTEQLGSTYEDYGLGVSVDSSGNAYVAGCTYGNLDGNNNAGNNDTFLTKYDTNGTKLWIKQLDIRNYTERKSVSVDDNGNAYVTSDIFLIKISTIPEPGCLAMLAGIGFMALLYRKRKAGGHL